MPGTEKRKIRVVAALVHRDGLILVTRRPDKSHFGGWWEFPGGKVEPGESDRHALAREIMEEMGVVVEPLDVCYSKVFEYETIILNFHLYNCAVGELKIRLDGIQDFAWVAPEKLPEYRFPPADSEVVDLLSRGMLLHSGGRC